MATTSQQRVFISYGREDIAFARELRERLLGMGHAPWMDLFDIPAGVRWPDAIDRALRSADVVLGVMSGASLMSDNVKNEWDWAIVNHKRLALLYTEPCEVPFHYVSLNYLDFTAGNRDAAFAQLDHAINSPPENAPLETTTSPAVGDAAPAPVSGSAAGGGRSSRLRAALHRGPATRAVVVGRDDEREMLRQRVTQAIDGSGSLLLIGGEAGIGKTTLVTDVSREAEERGCLVLSGGCYDLTTTPPYGPWVQILAAYEPAVGMPVVPAAIRDEAGLQSISSRDALFELVGEFFAEIAEQRPLLLVLEDLHWSDPASLEFLRFLCRFLSGLPILVVATYREDELTRRHLLWDLLPILLREAPAAWLSLHPLPSSAVRELVDMRYHLPNPDAERLVTHLLRLAEGNPFFTRELLQSLEEDGLLLREEMGWVLGDLARAPVPMLVRQVVDRRLARLDDATRDLFQVAAVIGHDVPYELWKSVSGAAESELLSAVQDAIDARIVEDTPGGQGFRFHHALVREALYEGFVSLRRRAVHREVADALIATTEPVADAVAYHLEQCDDPRLADWLIRAGEHAERRWSWIIAVDRLDRAQRLINHVPSRQIERAWLLLRIGMLKRYTTSDAEKLAYLEEAKRLTAALDDPLLSAHVLVNHGYLQCFASRLRSGLADMEAGLAAIEALDGAHDSGLISRRYHRGFATSVDGPGILASLLAIAGRYQDALATIDHWYGDTADIDSPDVHQTLGLVCAIAQGNPDQAQVALRRSRALFEDISDHSQTVYVMLQELAFVLLPYRPEQVDARQRLADDAHALIADILDSIPTFYTDPDYARCFDWFVRGNWDRMRSIPWFGPYRAWDMYGIFGRLLYHQGDHQQLRQWFDGLFPAGYDTAPGDQAFATAVDLQLIAADIALDAGDLASCRAWLEARDRWMAWSGATLGRAEGHLGWTRYYSVSGDLALSRQHAEAALAHASQPRQPLALVGAHRALSMLDIIEQRFSDAHQHLNESLSLADACSAPFERALTLLALAELDIATNRDAARNLVEARAICESLGARPTLERLAALEERLTARNASDLQSESNQPVNESRSTPAE